LILAPYLTHFKVNSKDDKIVSSYSQKQNYLLDKTNLIIEDYNERLKTFSYTTEEGKEAVDSFVGAIDHEAKYLKEYLTNLKGAPAVYDNYTKYAKEATIKTIAFKAATVALNSVVSFGISLFASFVVKSIGSLITYYEDAAEKSTDLSKKASEAFQTLEGLRTEYESLGDRSGWDTADEERALEIQKEIVKELRGQGGVLEGLSNRLDLVNGKYGDQLGILKDITLEQAKQNRAVYDNDVKAKEALLVHEHGGLFAKTRVDFFSGYEDSAAIKANQNASNILKDAGYSIQFDTETAIGSLSFGDLNMKKAEDILKYYDKLSNAIRVLSENLNRDDLENNTLTSSLIEQRDALEEYVSSYREALDAYNENEGIIKIGEYLKENAVESKDAYKDMINELVNSSDGISDFETWILRIAEDTFPELAKEAHDTWGDMPSLIEDVAESADKTADAFANVEAPDWETLNTSIDKIQDAYQSLISAIKEYNASGYLSMDTLQSLLAMDSKYLSCLDVQGKSLRLNTSLFQELTKAELDKARAEAVDQYMTDLKTIAEKEAATTSLHAAEATVIEERALADLSKMLGAAEAATVGYARAAALLDMISAANAKDAEATARATEAYKNRLALIDRVAKQAASGVGGLSNTLNDYSDSSNAAKEAAEQLVKQLEKQQKLLKVEGEAAVEVLEKQIEAIEKERDEYDDAIEDQIDAIEKEKEAYEEAYEDKVEAMEDELEAYQKANEAKIKGLKEEQEALEETTDAQIEKLKEQLEEQTAIYDERIKALQEQRDAIDDLADAEDRELKLAQLRDELARAQTARTKHVYVEGQGWIWTTDDEAIADAENALAEQIRENAREDAIKALEDEIEALENARDAYEETIDAEIEALEKKAEEQDKQLQDEIDRLEEEQEKREEAHREELDRMEEEREAFNENVENRIEKLEEEKVKKDEWYESEIERINNLKKQYEEALDLIGQDWDEYNAKLDAIAKFEAQTFDEMTSYVSSYKESVLANMKAICEANAAAEESVNSLKRAYAELGGGDKVGATTDPFAGVQRTDNNPNDAEQGDQYDAALAEKLAQKNQNRRQVLGGGHTTQGSASSQIGMLGGDGVENIGGLWYVVKHYATGSRSIVGNQAALVHEAGNEIIVRRPNQGRFVYLEDQDGVIPANITSRLFEIGGNTSAWFARQMMNYGHRAGAAASVVTTGDIIIQKPVGDEVDLAKALKQRFGPAITQELKRR